MNRPRQLLLGSLLVLWVGLLLACGGVGQQADRSQNVAGKATQTEADNAATNAKETPKTEAEAAPKLDWSGKLNSSTQ